jgi:hypothetical protein
MEPLYLLKTTRNAILHNCTGKAKKLNTTQYKASPGRGYDSASYCGGISNHSRAPR